MEIRDILDKNISKIHDILDKKCIYCELKLFNNKNELDYINDDNTINFSKLNLENNIKYHTKCYKDKNISKIHDILDKKCIYCDTKLSSDYNEIDYLNNDNSINVIKLNSIKYHMKCYKDKNISEIRDILNKNCIYCNNKISSEYNELHLLNNDNSINYILSNYILNNIYHTNCYKENNILKIRNELDKNCIYCKSKLSSEYNELEYLNDDNSIKVIKLNNIKYHIKCKR